MIKIVTATRGGHANFDRTPLGSSAARVLAVADNDVQLQVACNNRRGLSEVYNEAIDAAADGDLLVFVHDDVRIDDWHFVSRIREACSRYAVVGVAGNVRYLPGMPSWACVADGDGNLVNDDPANLRGSICHLVAADRIEMVVAGPSPSECAVLDGVLLATVKRNLCGVRFDSRFAFHFYDLDFCRECQVRGVSAGVWPIAVTHSFLPPKGGMSVYRSDAWGDAYEVFLDKYGVKFNRKDS